MATQAKCDKCKKHFIFSDGQQILNTKKKLSELKCPYCQGAVKRTAYFILKYTDEYIHPSRF